MAAYYGAFAASEIRDTIVRSSAEAYRSTRNDGFMAFKWNSHDVRIDHVIDLMEGWEPLFGHRVSVSNHRKSSTSWVLLRKRNPGYQPLSSIQRVLEML